MTLARWLAAATTPVPGRPPPAFLFTGSARASALRVAPISVYVSLVRGGPRGPRARVWAVGGQRGGREQRRWISASSASASCDTGRPHSSPPLKALLHGPPALRTHMLAPEVQSNSVRIGQGRRRGLRGGSKGTPPEHGHGHDTTSENTGAARSKQAYRPSSNFHSPV